MISNVYAAYTAGSEKSNQHVSELSKMVKGADIEKKASASENPELNMDKVIISKEALEKLNGSGLTSTK